MSFERILVVDDDEHIANYVQHCLKQAGYQVHVTNDARKALTVFEQYSFQLVILDIMMPKMDGFQLLTQFRRKTDVPIIFLSARGDEPDKIVGLGLGADDYITKPFSSGELLARVAAHLRRYNRPVASSSVLHFNELVINKAARSVSKGEHTVELTKREFDILAYLAEHPGQVFSFQQIYEAVWQEEYLGNSNVVMVHIRRIREKLADDPKRPRFIETVWGVGYKFLPESR